MKNKEINKSSIILIIISIIAVISIILNLNKIITGSQLIAIILFGLVIIDVLGIVQNKNNKRNVRLYSVNFLICIILIIYAIFSGRLLPESKINTLEHNTNEVISKYLDNEDELISDKVLLNVGKTTEYNGCKIELESYVYDKELKIAYVKIKASKSGIGAGILDNEHLVSSVKNMPGFSLLTSIFLEEDYQIGFSISNRVRNFIRPDNYMVKRNSIEMSYYIPDFDGKIYIYDFNNETYEEAFELEDTVSNRCKVTSGVYLSELGLIINENDENKYNCVLGFDVEIEYSDGSKKNIKDISSDSNYDENDTIITDSSYVYYIFNYVQDIKQITKVFINGDEYDVEHLQK